MSGPSPVQRLHANLAFLKSKNAPDSRIQEELDKFRASQDAISAGERKLSGAEKVAAVGSKLGSGATFGLMDEAAGLIGGKDEQRFLQKGLEEEHPGVAMGAEVLGSLAMPGSFLKAAPRAASMAVKAGKVLAEGALQGGLAGVGNAEGGLEERIKGAAKGASIGSAAAGAFGGAGKLASATWRKGGEALGLTAPSLEDLVAKVPNEDVARAKLKLEQMRQRNLTHETTVADVLPQGEGALRQAATANRAVRKDVDQQLRSRANRLSNEADARFSQHTGTQPESAENALAQIDDAARTKAKPLYAQAQAEAAAAPKVERMTGSERKQLMEMGIPEDRLPALDAIDEALALPYVQQRIGQLKSAPRSKFAKMPDDQHEMLDQVYKDIGRHIRSLDRKDWSLKDDLIKQRAILAEGITSRSQSYQPALEAYAGDMAHKDAYLLGHQKTPSDVIPGEMAGLDQATVPNYKQGKAQSLRRDVPNIDVGEFSRFQDVLAPIATKEKAAVFKATFGDKAYKEYVRDLLGMAELQRMRGGAGESTTVDKLMEQLQAGGDPHQVAMAIADLVRGNPARAVARAAPLKVIDNLRNSRVAKTNADFLLRRGDQDVSRSLDEIVSMRHAGQQKGSRSYRGRPGQRLVGVTARTAGANAGKP